MQAIILCGGRGTRLSALYPDRPKALVPVAGKPFLEWQIDWLLNNNIQSIFLASGYIGNRVQDWVQEQTFKKCVAVSVEPEPLGTGGALKYLAETIGDNLFFTLNGDSLLPKINFQEMEKAHRKSGALGTIAVTRIEDSARYGTVTFDNNGKILNFNEKGKSGPGWINAGIYLLEPSVLSVISPNKNVSLENEVFQDLTAEGNLLVFQAQPPLLDMGTPEGLQAMEQYLYQAAN